MRIWMDAKKMSAYSVTGSDIQAALARENVELPSGKLSGNATDLSVRTFGRLNTEEEFKNVIIRSNENGVVRLGDVAEAVLGPENEETILKESAIPIIGMALIPLPGSNYVAISDEFYKRFEEIKKDVPPDIKVNIALDQTKFIRKSLSEVKETLFISIGLVVLIIYLFFPDWRIFRYVPMWFYH